MYRIGIDVGGTFTDLVAVRNDGQVTLAKAATTPTDPSSGVMDALDNLVFQLGADRAEILRRTILIVHGTTAATNALLERKGARVALLATEGHRDVLEMREGLKGDRYNLQMRPPTPIVPRHRRLAVRERMLANGKVEIQLDIPSLDEAIDTMKRLGVEAVAICFLHSYSNPTHEAEAARRVLEALPNLSVVTSESVLPTIGEYQRTCTTVVTAYVARVLSRYLERLQRRLAEASYRGSILIMRSNGGVAPIADAARVAAGCVLSGPAAGVAASRLAGELIQERNLLTLDMGGTSTDLSRIVNGHPQLVSDKGVGDIPIALPSVDITTLGAGGGSIAALDRAGVLRVGPESAGADPGPACYGRGGQVPTVTDASLALGYLNPHNFLGGQMTLDVSAAHAVIDGLAKRLGIDEEAAAYGIHEIVNTRMAEGIRLVSVKRGIDPRRFTLLAFGGAAGLHVTDVARRLSIRRVVVPREAPVLSAWGMLASDLRYEGVTTRIAPIKELRSLELREIYARLEDQLLDRLAASHSGPTSVRRSADLRYGEQTFEIEVEIDGLALDTDDLPWLIAQRFHERHEALYTYSLPDQDVVFVNARVAVSGKLPPLPAPKIGQRSAMPPQSRLAYLSGWQQVSVFDWNSLRLGESVRGPAIIEADATTVLLRVNDHAAVTHLGWLNIDIA
jgi:N-methylhydantoinase A